MSLDTVMVSILTRPLSYFAVLSFGSSSNADILALLFGNLGLFLCVLQVFRRTGPAT